MSAPLSEAVPTKTYLWNWREILAALALPNDDEHRRQVRNANIRFKGPIVLPTKGGQPNVCRERLLAWWDLLDKQFSEQQQKQIDAQATVAARYRYGNGARGIVNSRG